MFSKDCLAEPALCRVYSLTCCFAYEFSVIEVAKLRQTTNDLHYWLHLRKKILHSITFIMLTNKSVVVVTGLD